MASDGLPVRDSGRWARDKLYFLSRYMDIFSTGMKRLWPQRVYVDLMAGPGLCRDRSTGEEFEGSPLLAVPIKTPFTKTVFVERDVGAADALELRLGRAGSRRPTATVLRGDCNDPGVIALVKRHIGVGLGLVFIDLIGLDVSFDTVRRLTTDTTIDLVVTFPDMDLKRNAPQANDARWTAFFGGVGWRETVRRWERHQHHSGSVAALLVNLYRRELQRQLGYRYSTAVRPMVNARRVALYRPLFASRHPKGLEFWWKISRTDRSGQGDLFD